MKTLDNDELSYFCAQMSMILKSGISSIEGLYMLQRDDEASDKEREMYTAILDGLESGEYLASSMEGTGLFPPYVVKMAKIGEETGTLDNVMDSLSRHYEREEEIRQAVRQAVTYPTIMACMILAVILLLLVEVMPVFRQVFRQLGTEMTGIAGILYNIGALLRQYAVVLAILLAVAMFVLVFCIRTEKGRNIGRTFLNKFRFFRQLQNDISTSRFAGGVALAIRSGFSADFGIEMVAGIIEDDGFSAKIDKCRQSLADGDRFDEALRESGILTGVNARMMAIGVRTGESDAIMERISDLCQRRAETSMSNALATIEPTLVVTLSIVIGIILLSVMFPLLGVVSSI